MAATLSLISFSPTRRSGSSPRMWLCTGTECGSATRQRFTKGQLQRRKAFESQLLGKFNHAGLTHTGFRRQLLRAEVPGLIGLA